ncbi:hypothetical protein NEDG_02039 [Nematocida displodere]|uniref:Uncharacterized protein n=1 Tax=Nematocida displodere TaxID=1805483 RepID=A0A177EK85_9MICR|nr:hypothetical protein NEDG_02039 [Nematocida displodere]
MFDFGKMSTFFDTLSSEIQSPAWVTDFGKDNSLLEYNTGSVANNKRGSVTKTFSQSQQSSSRREQSSSTDASGVNVWHSTLEPFPDQNAIFNTEMFDFDKMSTHTDNLLAEAMCATARAATLGGENSLLGHNTRSPANTKRGSVTQTHTEHRATKSHSITAPCIAKDWPPQSPAPPAPAQIKPTTANANLHGKKVSFSNTEDTYLYPQPATSDDESAATATQTHAEQRATKSHTTTPQPKLNNAGTLFEDHLLSKPENTNLSRKNPIPFPKLFPGDNGSQSYKSYPNPSHAATNAGSTIGVIPITRIQYDNTPSHVDQFVQLPTSPPASFPTPMDTWPHDPNTNR